MTEHVDPLQRDIEIAAPPAKVWELVHDLTRMPEWSATLVGTRYREGGPGEVGARFTNRNRDGELEWTTHGVVTGLEPQRHLAFRIEENWAVWSFTLDPMPDDRGTVLTHRRETPEGISELSRELTDGFMGGQEAFTAKLLDSMQATVQRLKDAAEARA